MSYNAKNYVEQGGDVTVIGGELNVAAGGKSQRRALRLTILTI